MDLNESKLKEIAKIIDLPVEQLNEYSKELVDIDATYFWNPARGGVSIIVSNTGKYLVANSSINFEKLLEEFKNGRRNGTLYNDIFTSFLDMNCEEIKKLVNDKIKLLKDKLDGQITDEERVHSGYLFWNMKMILRNIYWASNKLVNKFADELTDDEISCYKSKVEIIKNSVWENIDDIKDTYDKIK